MLYLVTFKDLQKAIQSQAGQIEPTLNLQAKLQDKPFWIFDHLFLWYDDFVYKTTAEYSSCEY